MGNPFFTLPKFAIQVDMYQFPHDFPSGSIFDIYFGRKFNSIILQGFEQNVGPTLAPSKLSENYCLGGVAFYNSSGHY